MYTRPCHEKTYYNRLKESKIMAFLPTRKVLRVWHDRKKYVDDPLFPSYVFIYLKDRQDYYDGMDAEGYLYYVKCGREIARVQDSVVKNIELLTGLDRGLEVSTDRFEPGIRCVISQGALTGVCCELIEYNGARRVLVRVDLLQRNLLVTLSPECLMVQGASAVHNPSVRRNASL